MHWRFVDRILEFDPWEALRSRKTVSFEEYTLLERHGRAGAFPECLVVESCVESVRWLVAASSGFESVSALAEVGDFSFRREIGMGDALEIAVIVHEHDGNRIQVECRVCLAAKRNVTESIVPETVVAQGTLVLEMVPLLESFEREDIIILWDEIHAAS